MSADNEFRGTPEMGDRVEDRLTGWKGIAVAEMRRLFGCRSLTVESEDPADIEKNALSFDATRLRVVKKAVLDPTAGEK